MSLTSLRFPLVPALVLGAALSLVGCKQSNGERCEIDSDCASGICGTNGNPVGMTSSSGLKCVASLGPGETGFDAGASDGNAAVDAPVDGAASEVGTDAGDAGTDGAASDASPSDAIGSDASDAGTDGAPSADGATDAGADGAAAGG